MNSNYLKLLVATCATGVISDQEIQAQTSKQPNIIFIMADDLGWGDLGFQFQNQRAKLNVQSEPWSKTPNLDRMAAQGVQLPNQYCPAPVCAPSRASLMLGRHQGHANVRDNQFDKAIENNHTIATVLKAVGYSTAAFGKWGLQGQGDTESDWVAHPLNRGFDYYFGYIRHKDGHEHYPKEGIYDGPKEVWENHSEISKNLDKCYTCDLWTAAAKKWIIDYKKGKNADQPFFIYLAYDTPHAVIELPTQAYPESGGLNGGLQWIGQPGHMINTASGVVDSWIHPDYANETYDNDKNPATPEVAWPDVYKRYATSTRRIDCAIGDLIQLLKDLKIDNNTMIIFTTDNGPTKESYLAENYEPNFFNGFGPFDGIKRDVLEGGVRVSALAYWPDHFPAGRVVKTASSSYDWLPTFAQMAGVPAPAVTDGVSLLPSLTGTGKQRESFVYVEYFEGGKTPEYDEFIPEHQGKKRNQMQMVRLGDYVGVRYDIQTHNDNFGIFNVVKDPQQARNLAMEPGMASLQQQMKDKVLQSRRPNTSAPRPYDNELVPAVVDKKVVKGINWKTYSGAFPWVPEVVTLKPCSIGKAALPAANLLKAEDDVLYCDGYLRIPQDGDYTFSLNVSGSALLRIHEATIIDADYGYEAGTERSGTIKLKAGLHPFRLYYKNQKCEKPMLNFTWQGPGISIQSVPVNVFYHD